MTNNTDKKIVISLEPEGTIHELLSGDAIRIELFAAASGPIIDLHINKDIEDVYISIWPDQGQYDVSEN